MKSCKVNQISSHKIPCEMVTYLWYKLIRLRHYCSIPEAKLQCTKIRGSHPYINWMHVKYPTIDFLQYIIHVLITRIKCPTLM